MITFTIVKRVLLKENVKNTTLNAFYLKTTAKWYKNSFGGGFFWGIIAPRPAGPYPDISLAGKNPMSVALTERHHKSQDIYLLGKNAKKCKKMQIEKNGKNGKNAKKIAKNAKKMQKMQ